MIQIKNHTLELRDNAVYAKITCRTPSQAKVMWRRIHEVIRQAQREETEAMWRDSGECTDLIRKYGEWRRRQTDTGHARPKSDEARDV